MSSQTIPQVRTWDEKDIPLPVFFCTDCGDLFIFAVVASRSESARDKLEQLHLITDSRYQKPRLCPQCGVKNKVTP